MSEKIDEEKEQKNPEPEKNPEPKKAKTPKQTRAEKFAILRQIGFDTKSAYWQKASEKTINKTIKFFS